mmetsp:Transcript_12696/g.50961  ORF Transcript_12696/g.50961 Transcript_12696/m.50961 type:complete len:216 (-) Transcript_12696:169-816(-)
MVLAVPIERPREGVEEVVHVHLVLLPLLVRAGAGEVVRLVQLDGDELREAHRRGEDVRVNVPRPSAKVVEREAPLERVRDEVAVQLPDVFALLVFVFILREFRARLEHIGELRGIDRPVGIAVQTVRDHVVVVVGKVPRDDPLERGPVSRAARRRSVAPSFTLQGGSVQSHVAVVPSRGGLARIVRVEVPVVGVLAHEPPAVVQAFARGGRHFSL